MAVARTTAGSGSSDKPEKDKQKEASKPSKPDKPEKSETKPDQKPTISGEYGESAEYTSS